MSPPKPKARSTASLAAGFGASPGSPEPARLNKHVGKKINAKIYVERKKQPTLEFELGYLEFSLGIGVMGVPSPWPGQAGSGHAAPGPEWQPHNVSFTKSTATTNHGECGS